MCTMLIASGLLQPDEVQSLKALLEQIEVGPHVHLEAVPGGVNVFVDSKNAAELFRESLHVGLLGHHEWGTKLKLH